LKNLYDQGVINKQIFSFKPVSDEKGKFYIGEYHSDFNKDYAKCNIYDKGNNIAKLQWACRLAYIVTGDISKESFLTNAYSQYQDFIIDSGSAVIIAPSDSLSYFTNNLLKGAIEKGECHKYSYQSFKTFICTLLDVDALPPVYFVLNGYGIKISAKYLFVQGYASDKLSFNIIFKDDMEFWLIGQPLFYENHILFDNENNLVAFSGEFKDFTEFTSDKDFVIGDYIVIIVVVPIVGVIFILTSVVIICRLRKKYGAKDFQHPVSYV
jgi:hypothetical protein